jgi:hypothetical protein
MSENWPFIVKKALALKKETASANTQENGSSQPSIKNEVKLLTGDRGDYVAEAEILLNRISGFNSRGELLPDPINLSEAILIFTEVIREDPTETDYPNNVLYYTEKTIKSLFEAYKRIDASAGIESLKPFIYQLSLFFQEFGMVQFKWGLPIPKKNGVTQSASITELKKALLEITYDSFSLHQITFQKLLEQILFPQYDQLNFSNFEFNRLIEKAKAERLSNYPKMYQFDSRPNLDNRRRKINIEIGFNFEGHGIDNHMTHGSHQYSADLRALIHLLKFGEDPNLPPLFTTSLTPKDEGAAALLGASHPYTEGGFIIVSFYQKPLSEGVGAVLVNPHFYHAIPELKKIFADMTFIKADELPDKLYELVPKEALEKLN